MKKNNKQWFTIILAMWIVLIIGLMAYNILDYIIPFWREVKWIENSSRAYYLANNWIESALYNVNLRNNSWSIDDRTEYWENFVWDISTKYNTFSSWNILPPEWEWNSEYDNNWNIISQWNPIQLSIWNWYLNRTTSIKAAFRVPKINNIWWSTLSWNSMPIISWQLSSNNNSLNASWWIILASNVLSSDKTFSNANINWPSLSWVDLDWNEMSIADFYWNSDITWHCYWTNSWCILKFSIINKLELNLDDIGIPYLEWKNEIDNAFNVIPLRYTKVSAAGKSMWYKKELEIKIPWKTLNQAFDFTVFQ